MSAMQRRKGQQTEREFLRLLGDELGQLLTRNLQQTREGGADCICIRGWAIECKRHESLSRPAWWRQAVEQAERIGSQPMLAYRRSREPWRVWVKEGQDITIKEAAGLIREKWLAWP